MKVKTIDCPILPNFEHFLSAEVFWKKDYIPYCITKTQMTLNMKMTLASMNLDSW